MAYYGNSPTIFFGGPLTRTVKLLIIADVAVYVLQVVEQIIGSDVLVTYFGLSPRRVTQELMVWEFATYMFLHGGVFHLFFNMLTLFMFGNELDRYWGARRFLRYYFLTGIGAGVCSWLVSMNAPAVIIGASGAIYGLLLAYGLLYPNRIVYINLLIPVKVKYLVIFMGAVSFISSVSGGEPGVAHVAHLAGMLVGLVYLKGGVWLGEYQRHHRQRKREELKKQFEVYYGEVRRKIDEEKKGGPTIH
jgi:membrane associated rhomboid family serine protease